MHSRRYAPVVLLVATAAVQHLASGTAGAQQQPAPPRFRSEVIVTAERAPEPRDHTPAATSLLTTRDIERLAVFTLAELVDHLPGFRVLGVGVGASSPIVAARGFFGGGETDPVHLLIDGVPVADAESGLVDWHLIRASDIERVETLRGAGGSLYGGGSDAGVIQVFTSSPQRRTTQAQAWVGSFATRTVDAMTGSLAGPVRFRLGAGFLRSTGYREHAGVREAQASAAIGSSLSAWEWHARGSFESREHDSPGPLSAAEVASGRRRSSPLFANDAENRRAGRLAFSFQRASSGSPRGLLYVSRRDATITRTVPILAGIGSTATRTLTGTRLGGTVDFAWQPSVRGTPTDWRAGGEVVRDGVESAYALESGSGGARSRPVRNRVGLFASHAWQVVPRVRLLGGVRWDYVQDDDSGRTIVDHAWSPRLGVTALLPELLQSPLVLFAHAAGGFRSPTLDQRFDIRPYPDFRGGTLSIANPSLKPQRSVTAEIGLRHAAGSFRWEATGFVSRLRDEIDFDAATFAYGNIGRSRHAGIELETAWQARVSPSVSYAWTRVRSADLPGEQLKNIPQHVWRASATMQVTARLLATLRYTATAGAYADDENRFPLDGASTIDARIAYRISRGVLRVDLMNVAGDVRDDMGFVVPDVAGRLVPHYYPGAGASVRAGVAFAF